jgi:hypothetical protein
MHHSVLVLMVTNRGGSMSHEFDPRMTVYFGDTVLRAGFLPTPHLFMRHYVDLGLDSTLAMFVLQLMETTWDLGSAPKTSRDFAQRMGVGTKAIQRYTSRIEALGLMNVTPQFDGSGAQIENRYDLSPLFERLAGFAVAPSRQLEQRRQSYRTEESLHPSQHEHQAGRQGCPGSPDPLRRGTPDRTISGPGIVRSGLKETLRIINNQQEDSLHDAAGADSATRGILGQGNHVNPEPPAWSIRQQRLLTPDEIAMNQTLLTRMAIDNPVRSRIARRMAPDDLWALRVYSAAKGWSPALTVTQVYDKRRKQVQIASDLEAEHYQLGTRLAALDHETAEAALELVLQCCPHAPQRLETDPLLTSAAPALLATIESLWRVIAQLRGFPQACLHRMFRSNDHASADDSDETRSHPQLWQAVLQELQSCIPESEFATWLSSSVLLALREHVDEVHVVVGVSNIFARDHVTRFYAPRMAHTLVEFLGKPVTVQVELESPASTRPVPSIGPLNRRSVGMRDGQQPSRRGA